MSALHPTYEIAETCANCAHRYLAAADTLVCLARDDGAEPVPLDDDGFAAWVYERYVDRCGICDLWEQDDDEA
jgi:hypothetical protein